MRRASRLETFLASPAVRGRILLLGWVIALGGLLFRAGEVQLGSAAWQAEAERQHRAQGTLPAPRGAILDRSGVPLAMSHEVFRVADRSPTSSRTAKWRRSSSPRRWESAGGGPAGHHLEPALGQSSRHASSAGPGGALGAARGSTWNASCRASTPTRGSRAACWVCHRRGGDRGHRAGLRCAPPGMPGTRVVSRDSEGVPSPGESWVVQAPRRPGATSS
jgi:hypothetical protein